MNKKKLIYSLGFIGAVATPLSLAISCGNNYGKNYAYYGDIQIITDAGTVADKSFNQSAFSAAKDYANIVAPKKDFTYGFTQPPKASKTLLQKSYYSALKKHSKYLVLPGFIHSSDGDGIHFAIDKHKEYPNVKYINIDGFADDKTIGDGTYGSGEKKAIENNWFNLGFASQESGFLAAVYGGLYFNNIKHVESPIKAATFGGLPIKFGVTSYMDGWLQGIHWFNNAIINKSQLTFDSSNKVISANKQMQKIEAVFLKDNKPSLADFTGGFAAGLATSKAQKYIVEKGVQMILPVAGPQTGDVVGIIASNSKKGKAFVFGVDVDQSKVYNSDYFLGSALKGIYAATSFAIDELKKGPKKEPFKTFSISGLKDEKDPTKKSIVGEYLENLRNNITPSNPTAEQQYDAIVKTQPTGIAIPKQDQTSNKIKLTMGGLSPDKYQRIFKDAYDFVSVKDNVINGLDNTRLNVNATGSQNAKDTWTDYGTGYTEIAWTKEIEDMKGK